MTRLAGVLAGALVVLAACATLPATPALDAERARTVADLAARAAVMKPGVRVCRQVSVGIAERDWLRGAVVEVTAERIAVRIDDAGRFQHTLEGAPVVAGTLVWSAVAGWIPCL
jgi:hypothetical protein